MAFVTCYVKDGPEFGGGVLVVRVRIRTEMVRRDDLIRISMRAVDDLRLREDLGANKQGQNL